MQAARQRKSEYQIVTRALIFLMVLTAVQLIGNTCSRVAVASSQDPVPPKIAYGSLLARVLTLSDAIPTRQWFSSALAEVASSQDPVPAREKFTSTLAQVASSQDPVPVRQKFTSSLSQVASGQDPIPVRQRLTSILEQVASSQDPIPVRPGFTSPLSQVASGQDPVPVRQRIAGLLEYLNIDLGEAGYLNVNLRDGGLLYHANDLAFQSVLFNRVYNSRTGYASRFDESWMFTYDRKVHEGTDGNVNVISTTGQSYLYTPNGDGTYTKPAGALLELRKLAEGQQYFRLSDKQGNLTEYYDSTGKLVEVQTRFDGVRIYYEGNSLVAVGSESQGTEVRLLAQGYGANPEYVVDPENRTVRYIQDENGRLKSVINAGEIAVTYEYAGRLLTGIIDDRQNKTVIAYDEFARVSSITNADGQKTTIKYDGPSTIVSMPEEQVYRYNFNADGNVISIFNEETFIAGYTWEENRLTALTDAANNTYRYYYDELGRLVHTVDPLQGETIYTYDGCDNLTSVTDPEGVKASFAYDRENRLIAMWDNLDHLYSIDYDTINNYITIMSPLGQRTIYKLDSLGNFAEVQDVAGTLVGSHYDLTNRLTSHEVRNKDGRVYAETELGYDDLHRLVAVTDLAGNTLTRRFDQNGNLQTVLDQSENEIGYTYTALNQLQTLTVNGNEQYRFTYDNLGRLSTVNQSGQEHAFQFYYNPQGELEVMVEPDGSSVKYTYDTAGYLGAIDLTYQGIGFSSRYEYDALGEQISARDYLGARTDFLYASNGQLSNVVYPTGLVKTIHYDQAGRVSDCSVSGTPVQESYTYDNNNNLLSITDGNGRIRNFTYNELNYLEAEIDPYTGERTVYNYDPAGNRTNKSVYNPDGSLKTSTDYSYQGLGGIVNDGRVYKYDSRGNLIADEYRSYVWDELNRLTEVRDRENRLLASFIYDFQGNRLSKTTTQGTTYYHYAAGQVAYETDIRGNITNMYTYDASGCPVTLTRDGLTYYYVTNQHGDVVALTDGYGRMAAFCRYDAFGNVTEEKGEVFTLNPYRYASYTYDPETGLYYVGGVYYDADAGRFLSRTLNLNPAATPGEVNGFTYGANRPTINSYGLVPGNYCAICKCIWCLMHKLHPDDRVNPYQG